MFKYDNDVKQEEPSNINKKKLLSRRYPQNVRDGDWKVGVLGL